MICDAGKGFIGRAFKEMCERYSILLDPVATEAQWKNGAAERHGSILKIMMMKVMEEMNAIDYWQMKTVLVQCVCAKNRLARRCGVSPQQAVTGYDLPIPESILDCPDNLPVHNLMETNELMQYQALCRQKAAQQFFNLDHCDAVRRALTSQSTPPRNMSIIPGSQVMVWNAQ